MKSTYSSSSFIHTLSACLPWPAIYCIISLCYIRPPRSCLCLSHSTRAQVGPAVLVPALLLASSDKTSETSCADSAVWGTRGISSSARASWTKSNGPPRLRVFTTTSRYGYAVLPFPAEPGAAAKCPASP